MRTCATWHAEAMALADVFQRRSDGSSEPPTPVPPPVRPSVAEQIATLARLGLEPQGVTAADVAADKDATLLLKRHPYAAALHCLARDADGAFTHHPRVTTVDLEHVVGPDSYPALVRKLADAAGTSHLLGEVTGGIDRAGARWVLRFTFDDVTREIHPRLDHDRADPGSCPRSSTPSRARVSAPRRCGTGRRSPWPTCRAGTRPSCSGSSTAGPRWPEPRPARAGPPSSSPSSGPTRPRRVRRILPPSPSAICM